MEPVDSHDQGLSKTPPLTSIGPAEAELPAKALFTHSYWTFSAWCGAVVSVAVRMFPMV